MRVNYTVRATLVIPVLPDHTKCIHEITPQNAPFKHFGYLCWNKKQRVRQKLSQINEKKYNCRISRASWKTGQTELDSWAYCRGVVPENPTSTNMAFQLFWIRRYFSWRSLPTSMRIELDTNASAKQLVDNRQDIRRRLEHSKPYRRVCLSDFGWKSGLNRRKYIRIYLSFAMRVNFVIIGGLKF